MSSFISSKHETELTQLFNSFEQCNTALLDMEEIHLNDYINIIQSIPYEQINTRYDIDNTTHWLNKIVEYILSIPQYDFRAYKINVIELDRLGFDVLSYNTRMPRFLAAFFRINPTNVLRNQLRFLKRNKLSEGTDYIPIFSTFNDEMIEIGYCINKGTLYRLIAKQYGVKILGSILERISQIAFFYGEYKKNYKSKYIASLQRTIIGLDEDIRDISDKTKRMKIFRDSRISAFNSSNPSNMSDYSLDHSPVSSDVIMTNKEYTDEISSIHQKLGSLIQQFDSRISDVQINLINITTKINDLVGSINLTKNEYGSELEYQSEDTNPVINHVHNVFEQYKQTGLTPPISFSAIKQSQLYRNTWLG